MTDSKQEWREGDLVEAVKGEERHVGRLGKQPGGLVLRILWFELDRCPYVDFLERDGFTLTLVERAPEPLPTADGVYRDQDDDLWHLFEGRLALLTNEAGTLRASDAASANFGRLDAAKSAPLTRLEPVPVTRNAAINEVADWLDERDSLGSQVDAGRIREHFLGVTND